MDGEIVEFDPDFNRGVIIGEDRRRYGFVKTEWHSSGPPERGNAVRFVAEEARATQIYLRWPAYIAPLKASEAIDAVYGLALGLRGDQDLFGAAPVRWRNFLLPISILIVLGEVQVLLRGIPIDWQHLLSGK
jgi:hypothetical protein